MTFPPVSESFLRKNLRGKTTPLFIYDARIIRAAYRRLCGALPKGTGVLYAMKANPHSGVLQFMRRLGAGLDVASSGEIEKGLRAGFPASCMSFAGPGKTDAELSLAVRKGVGMIQIEAFEEAVRLNDIARRAGRKVRVGVRVNPRERAASPGMKMGGIAGPFGVDEEQLPDFFKKTASLSMLTWKGVHVYSTSQILKVSVIEAEMRRALEIALRVQKLAGGPLEMINLGGGFGIPYFEGDRALDMKELGQRLKRLFVKVQVARSFPRGRFFVESGRYLVGEAGVYLTRIVCRKVSRKKIYLVTDGGMNHHQSAAGLLGGMFRRNFKMTILGGRGRTREKVSVAGPLCTPLDLLARDIRLPMAAAGDILAVFNSGAYALTASPQEFLSHTQPKEVMR